MLVEVSEVVQQDLASWTACKRNYRGRGIVRRKHCATKSQDAFRVGRVKVPQANGIVLGARYEFVVGRTHGKACNATCMTFEIALVYVVVGR